MCSSWTEGVLVNGPAAGRARSRTAAALAFKAPFRCENFWLLATVALSFVFGKNYLIIDYLGLKDSSRDFSANCAISFFSSTFSTPCMCRKIRCDGYCVKIFGFWMELNGALLTTFSGCGSLLIGRCVAVEGSSPPKEGVIWTKWLEGLLLKLEQSHLRFQ